MPIIRATVTIADAIPNAARPAASTAAVERGVTVSPKPKPKAPRASGDLPIGDRRASSAAISDERRRRSSASPTSVTSRSDSDAHHEARDERAERGRPRQRPEREALLVRAAVQHAIDEDRAADDRGREARSRSGARRARPS